MKSSASAWSVISGLIFATVVASFSMTATSCTDAKLEPIPAPPVYRDDKLQITGGLCTREPESLVFPLRVLFIVDSSVSMEANDPPDPVDLITGRERAVRDTWTDLLDDGPEGVKVGIIRFSAQAQSRTGIDLDGDSISDSYYTSDRQLLDVATASLGVTDRTTNYINALGEAYFEMRTELSAADLESLPLSKYVVVFVSDGEPDTDDSEIRENSRQAILEAVEQMQDLAETFRVGDFQFHTAFIASGQAALDDGAKDLLQAMADRGNGNFRSFPSGEELNFLFIDFTVLRRVFTLRTFGVFNENAVLDPKQIPDIAPPVFPGADSDMEMDLGDMEMEIPADYVARPDIPARMFVDVDGSEALECGEIMADTDGDGLADIVEIREQSDPRILDTDDDGLNDYLEWQFRNDGLDLLDPLDSDCFVANACVDTDNNGACDCVLDVDTDGVCDCNDPDFNRDEPCADPVNGWDCVDLDLDGLCDCPDFDMDGYCDYRDNDGDGLHDCEEVFFGTAQNGADSDADGLPDRIEVRFQTNPAERDELTDLDADKTFNGVEVLANTNPACEDATLRSRSAYRYSLKELGLSGAQTCYDFNVSNITLVNTLETEGDLYPGNGWNRIYIYAGEVAFDDPNAFALYRIACVYAAYNPNSNYKNPPSGRIDLTEADFVEVEDFDPEIHCRYP